MHPSDANRTEKQSALDWNAIDWRKVNRIVRNLRKRIFRATQEGNWDKVQSLQRLMLRSTSNVAQSVRRVTQVNQGKNTPGVDKVLVKTPGERGKLAGQLHLISENGEQIGMIASGFQTFGFDTEFCCDLLFEQIKGDMA